MHAPIRRGARPHRGAQSGAAALELALVSPLFITLVFGIFNLGWALYCGWDVRHAIERSSRLLIADPGATADEIRADMAPRLGGAEIDDVGLTLTVETLADGSRLARLAWTYSYDFSAPFIDGGVFDFDSSMVVPLRDEDEDAGEA